MPAQIITMNIRLGTEPQFLSAFEALVTSSRAEPGCLRFDLLRDPEVPDRFIAYEVFADDAALAAHRASDHYRAAVAVIRETTTDNGHKRVLLPEFV